MSHVPAPVRFGSWEDAEALRRWSFQRRSPEQKLAWLVAALEIGYRSGAVALPAPPAQSRAPSPSPSPSQSQSQSRAPAPAPSQPPRAPQAQTSARAQPGSTR